MDVKKLVKQIPTTYWIVIIAAVIVGLYFMGALKFFMGAVVADVAEETKTCRIAGETWSPETLKCQCPAGQGYEFGALDKGGSGWTCVPLVAAPTATTEKPAAASTEKASMFSGNNMFLGIAIILGAIVFAMVVRKKK